MGKEKEIYNKEAGDQIKKCRGILKLSQKDLAQKLTDNGVYTSQVTLSRYENGDVTVPASAFLAIKKMAGM